MTTIILEGKEYQLDIEQAEKLGLLKEKDNRVRSWNKFKEKYKSVKGYTYSNVANCIIDNTFPINTHEQLTPHEAKAIAAFSELLKLRRDWIGEWEPDFTTHSMKWAIHCKSNNVVCEWCDTVSHVLSFPAKQMAQEFLETFRDLIEETKILL